MQMQSPMRILREHEANNTLPLIRKTNHEARRDTCLRLSYGMPPCVLTLYRQVRLPPAIHAVLEHVPATGSPRTHGGLQVDTTGLNRPRLSRVPFVHPGTQAILTMIA